MQAALDLADSGFLVHLVTEEPSIGGTMARLDKTFPTGDCAMCMISPRMVESGRHHNIKLHTLAKIRAIEGEAGNFTASIKQQARFIDATRCTGCGACEEACPTRVDDSFNQNLNKRKAVYALFPQAVPNTRAIDKNHCLFLTRNVCKKCEKVCTAEAINFNDTDKDFTLHIGAVVLSPGLSTYDPAITQEFGHGRIKDVITSLQFERLLSASGPCAGHVIRPSDGRPPKKIAWIQCVGSRNCHNGNNWCSSVCCMYAAKQAVIAKEHDKEVDATIFYMELRAHGKNFDRFIDQATSDHQLKYVRAMVSDVKEDNETGDLLLHYLNEDNTITKAHFDLVVLSIGFQPHRESQDFANIFGIEYDDFHFAATSSTAPLKTSKPGIFVAGSYQAPKDIPDTVTQASGAAAEVMALLSSCRGSDIEETELVQETDITGQKERIGVFVCHCGSNIAGTVDVKQVADVISEETGVEHSQTVMYACAPDGQEQIRKEIKEKGLNRIVVASCTPRTHAPLFQDTIREAGLNKYLFELADIREQCSWCHQDNPEMATAKAIDIVKMNVAKSRFLAPVEAESFSVKPSVLIIGGGITGMVSSLNLAEQGYKINLVEKEEELGGLLKHVHRDIENTDVQKFLQKTIEKVNRHPSIHIFTGAKPVTTDGFVGNFTTTLSTGETLEHGATLIASGGREYLPNEYGYASSNNIITQRQLEQKLAAGLKTIPKSIVMIQCVGSREEPANYCSRICCQDALKNALMLKETHPETQITILYRDLRAYGLKEKYYKKARELGVLFILYTVDRKPKIIEQNDQFRVLFHSHIFDREMEVQADKIVLSTGLRPREDVSDLEKLFKLTRNDDDFFLEAHIKLRPVDLPSEGLFLAGLAHSPKNLEETISQAMAAAGRIGALLSHDKLTVSGIVARHNRDVCMSCLACVRACPFGAPFIDTDGKISHNPIKCTGCGICAGVCPAKAFQINTFTDQQMLAMVDAVTGQ